MKTMKLKIGMGLLLLVCSSFGDDNTPFPPGAVGETTEVAITGDTDPLKITPIAIENLVADDQLEPEPTRNRHVSYARLRLEVGGELLGTIPGDFFSALQDLAPDREVLSEEESPAGFGYEAPSVRAATKISPTVIEITGERKFDGHDQTLTYTATKTMGEWSLALTSGPTEPEDPAPGIRLLPGLPELIDPETLE